MKEEKIVQKLKQDIEEKERSYQKELQKIKKEDDLLAYIKGILNITEKDVSNFPYYSDTSEDKEEQDAIDNFNIMLKYTLKEDKIIASFKAEVKNLCYLEKIGYQHAEQYEETKKHLEDYREKIKKAYEDLIANETLKKATAKKENILKQLDNVKNKLQEEKTEIENIDSFYEGLQYANLSESEKTEILFSIYEKNLEIEEGKLKALNHIKTNKKIERKIGRIKTENIGKIRAVVNKLEEKFPIKITYPKKEDKLFIIQEQLQKDIKNINQIKENVNSNRFVLMGENE